MVEADVRIEPGGKRRHGHILDEQCVEEGEQRIDRVRGWPPIARLEGEARVLDTPVEQVSEGGEVDPRGGPLEAQQRLQASLPIHSLGEVSELFDGSARLRAAVAADERARVANLAGDEGGRESRRADRGRAMLAHAQLDVLGLHAHGHA